MKTYAHKNAAGDIVGIGMIYMESGELTAPVADKIAALGEDDGIIAYGNSVRQDLTLTTIVIDTAQMPGDDPNTFDKTFRGAFKHGAGLKVDVDMPKAKTITKDRLRAERAPLLAAQDLAFQRALEKGVSTAAIATEKQRLRDITKAADTATTLDQLKALAP